MEIIQDDKNYDYEYKRESTNDADDKNYNKYDDNDDADDYDNDDIHDDKYDDDDDDDDENGDNDYGNYLQQEASTQSGFVWPDVSEGQARIQSPLLLIIMIRIMMTMSASQLSKN